MVLLADAQDLDHLAVPLFAVVAQVVEHTTALTNELEQTTTRVVILAVALEVLGEVGDALAEESNLDLGRTGVRGVFGKLANDVTFTLRREAH